ncbi:hypothetical protein K504DRAFT_470951 [Pleomassaria siparia CBS 279.74]|uniref:MARVEL domain-containing protein n=1 Tax=Pleomassaria siparia CBS 279.74 TaxID=1314801 RepID=A0A6G1K2X6_9PLEO|nr:hypothetical protein K504DRAFT_470951 [Pleomassaria siparia CBS 279.74]
MSNNPTVWKKRILIPFWVVRILLMLFIIGIYAIALAVIRKDPELTLPNVGVIVIFMLLIVTVLLMDVMAILMFLRDGLNPTKFLIMNVIQTSFWAAVLLLNVAAIARSRRNGTGIGFSVFVLFTFIGLLVYAVIGFNKDRKQRSRGNYASAHDPAARPLTHDAQEYSVPEYQSNHEFQQNPLYHSSTAYQPPSDTRVDHDSPNPQGAAHDYYLQQPERTAHMG